VVDRDTAGSRRLIVAWAIVFGFSVAVSTVMWRLAPSGIVTIEDVEAFAWADRYDFVPQLGYVIAAVLAILMIRKLTERQDFAFVDEAEVQHENNLRRAASFVTPAGYFTPADPDRGGGASPIDSATLPPPPRTASPDGEA
jgi:hypothetical protein